MTNGIKNLFDLDAARKTRKQIMEAAKNDLRTVNGPGCILKGEWLK